MKNTLIRILQITATVFLMLFSSSCVAVPTKPENPKTDASSTSATLKVIDIVGIHEWMPRQEGTIICAVEGPADSALKYSWSAEQGVISGEGKEVKWTAPETEGNYRLTVQVSNTKGESAAFSKTFKVTANPYNNETPDSTIYLKLSMPSSSIVEAAARLRSYTTLEIECQVDGIDPAELTYKWTSPTGKIMGNGLAEGKANRVGWIAPGVAGDYSVSVTVSDKSGNSAEGKVNFNVYCCRP